MSYIPLISGSPGVYRIENDNSDQIISQPTSRAIIVGATRRGPVASSVILNPFATTSSSALATSNGVGTITSSTSWTNTYGPSDLTWSYVQISALAYLNNGRNLQMLRVVNTDALCSTALVTDVIPAANPIPAMTVTNLPGYQHGASSGEMNSLLIKCNGSVTSGDILNAASLNITGGIQLTESLTATATAATGVNFLDSLYTSIATAVETINTACLTAGITGLASVQTINNGFDILVTAPENCLLSFSNGSVTNAGSVVSVAFTSFDPTLINVYASNPGTWSEQYGFNITNIATGTFQKVALQFSQTLSSAQTVTINLSVGGTSVSSTTTFTTNNDTTMAAVAANLSTAIISATTQTATVIATNANNGTTGLTEIVITAPVAANNYVVPSPLVLNPLSISGTAGNSITYTQTLAGQASANTFNFNVYSTANLSIPKESFLVSLYNQTDSFGNAQFIETVINNPASGSNILQVVVDPLKIGTAMPTDANSISNLASITFLAGGADGSLPTNGQIAAAWNTFMSAETYPTDILINAGYTATNVRQAIANVAATREDCFAILDTPLASISTNASGAGEIADRTTVMNINTSFAAAYTPWVQITDNATDQLVYVPPSGYIADRFCFTDLNYGFFQAPAGLNRGVLPVEGLNVIYEKPVRDLLDAVQLNALKLSLDGSGIVIWGDNTLQTIPSLLSAVNVRRCITIIENQVAAGLEGNVFDLDNANVQLLITQKVNAILQPIKNAGGIKDFLVVCNSSNNTATYEDAGQLNCSIYVIPVRASKIILLDTEIEPSSISFNEVVINGTL